MSEPKRYEPSSHYSADFGMAQSPVGKWVSYEDYARLKDEVERLKAELADAQESYHLVNEMVAKMLKERKQP